MTRVRLREVLQLLRDDLLFALDTATGRDSQTGSVASMLIVVVIVYDWRTRGRPRRADAYGCPHILTNMVDYQMNS